MKAAIYTRVSTSDQSTAMQLKALREYAKARKWKVIIETEETESGGKIDRPKRKEIIELAKKRKIDVILVWKLDRWSRSLSDLVITLDELSALGVAFVSAQESFDLTTPMGKAFAGMLGVFAEFERNMIRERVKAGVKRYREIHKRWGRPSKIKLYEKLVKQMAADGIPKNSIARELRISRATIWRILDRD